VTRGRLAALLLLTGSAALTLPPPLAAQRVAEVQLAPPLLRLRPGAQVQVLATVFDETGTPTDARLVWMSTNINVATVDSTGVVYAVAPGLAIITAASDSAGGRRRRTGRTTVFVSPPTAMGGDGKSLSSDTVPPAECADREFALRNPGRVCWNVRPSLRGTTLITPPSTCPTPVVPVVFHVRVSADGAVQETRVAGPSGCDAYRQMASDLLAELCCRPAYRNGRPVAAWTVVVIRPPVSPRVLVHPAPPAAPVPPTPGAPGATPPPPPSQPPRAPRGPAPDKQAPRP
jgi:hypothetical protein